MPIQTERRKKVRQSSLEIDQRRLLEALDRLVRAYQFRDRQRVCYFGLSINACYALQAIIRNEGMTQKQLAAELFLDKSTTSRLVDDLEQRGYLARVPDRHDGRAYRLQASESGRRLHTKIEDDLVRRQWHVMEDLPSHDRRAAILVLSRLANAAVDRAKRSN